MAVCRHEVSIVYRCMGTYWREASVLAQDIQTVTLLALAMIQADVRRGVGPPGYLGNELSQWLGVVDRAAQ